MTEFDLRAHLETGASTNWAVRYRDVSSVPVDEAFVERIQGYLTPDEMLGQAEFGIPRLIGPQSYSSFDSLIAVRDQIRTLQLLPVKTDDCYARYKAMPREELVGRVAQLLDGDIFALAPNEHPHDLSADVWQGVAWIRDPDTSARLVATFIAKSMRALGVADNDFISFQRPPLASAKLTRPTMPGIPHVHFWTRMR